MKRHLSILSLLLLTGCSYNPLSGNNHLTGTAAGTATGAAVGAGAGALAGGSRTLIGASALAGGAAGYYFSTIRSEATGVYHAGGQVYQLGLFTGIDIPADQLFEPNTADFLPQASEALDSVVVVLQRQPENNILISGNTSGFGRPKREQKLSEKRAATIASYLWKAGLNDFQDPHNTMRKLQYVGYGYYFPIATKKINNDLRQNNRIQITSYPSTAQLGEYPCDKAFHNIGATDTPSVTQTNSSCSTWNCKS